MLLKNTVSARDLQRNYKQVVGRVKQSDEPMVVLRYNQAEFALINLELLKKYRQQQAFKIIDEIRLKNKNKNQKVDFETAYQEITDVVEEVREEMENEQNISGS